MCLTAIETCLAANFDFDKLSDTTAASGPVRLANVTVGDFTVVDQAFSMWPPIDFGGLLIDDYRRKVFAPGNNVSIPDVFDGLLGLAA